MEKRIITWLRGRICTAFIQDGSLVELTLEDEDCSVLNRIYVGRVQKVVPGINAAFIDTGDGVGYYSLTENRSHLFTDRNRKEGPLRQGDEILVQISREGVATSVLSLPLKYMHTPIETLSLSDLEQTAQLLAAFTEDLGKGWPL